MGRVQTQSQLRLTSLSSQTVPPCTSLQHNMHGSSCVVQGSHHFQAAWGAIPNKPAFPVSDATASLTCLHHFLEMWACQGQCPTPPGSGASALGATCLYHFWMILCAPGQYFTPCRCCPNWFCSGGNFGSGVWFRFSSRATQFVALELNQPFPVCDSP